jgi:hypothetical protein
MKRICKRLLLLLATLGAGALAYTLMRSEGERVLRRVEEEPPAAPPPGPRPQAAAAEPARCIAITSSGERCERQAQPGSQYCWQHGG